MDWELILKVMMNVMEFTQVHQDTMSEKYGFLKGSLEFWRFKFSKGMKKGGFAVGFYHYGFHQVDKPKEPLGIRSLTFFTEGKEVVKKRGIWQGYRMVSSS